MGLSLAMTAIVASTLADLAETVSVPQLRILVLLHLGGPANLVAIARHLGVDRSNVSRPADRLVAAGLAERMTDEADRRSVVLSLTASGRRLVDSVMDRRREILGGLVGRLQEADRTALRQGVDALLRLVDDSESGAITRGPLLRWTRSPR